MITIYHNPRCSKSRAALALLEQSGQAITIIHYLKNPPSAATIKDLCRKLAISPEELIRQGEAVFKALDTSSQIDWCELMSTHPILIERPIIVSGDRAVIGRPPEAVLSLL